MLISLRGKNDGINLNGYILFTLLVIVIVLLNYGLTTFFFRPCSAHHWRQSDGASYALNYFQNHGSFLPPQVHHRHALDGFAVSEFPIFYYLASCLYSIFGFHDWILRWVHFSVLFLGLVYLMKLTSFFTSNFMIRVFPSLFLLTSSLIFYYGANFLPDVPSLSLNIIGLYFYFKWNKFYSPVSLIVAFVFFTLSALLKFSSVVLFAPVVMHLVLSYFTKKSDKEHRRVPIVLGTMLIVLSGTIISAWFFYAKYVATKYHFGGNLLGLYGIWDNRGASISYILSRLYQNWMHVYMAKYLWVQFLLFGALLIFYFRHLDKTLRLLCLLTLCFCILYCLAFFKVFDVHDYYLINTFVLPILVLLTFFEFAFRTWPKRIHFSLSIICLLGLIYTTYKSRKEQHFRYFEPVYNTFNQDYYTLEPELRKLGIKRNDLVFSVPDPSPNITLYLMNQIGYTECYNGDSYNIDYFRNSENVKYLIIGDSSYCKQAPYDKYCKKDKLMGKYKSISIYNLQ